MEEPTKDLLESEHVMGVIRFHINSMDIRAEISDEICALAKEHNILIAFGASDDLLELRGAIYDELSAYDGWDYENDISPKVKVLKDLQLKLIWINDEEETRSWKFNVGAHVKYNEFSIMEDGDVFCTGLIIQL